jgi:hypothetical protein
VGKFTSAFALYFATSGLLCIDPGAGSAPRAETGVAPVACAHAADVPGSPPHEPLGPTERDSGCARCCESLTQGLQPSTPGFTSPHGYVLRTAGLDWDPARVWSRGGRHDVVSYDVPPRDLLLVKASLLL